jgi:glucosamine--fructose-6-phosphate aminotransferase (isomerizing)
VTQRGQHTWHELCSQPDAWRDAVAVVTAQTAQLSAHPALTHASHIIWSGCGSPYFLAQAMARITQQLESRPSYAVPASELWLNPAASIPRNARPTLILLSRSGKTTEVLKAAAQFRTAAPHGQIITVSCYADRPLATIGDINIVLPSGQEESIAQTRAFTVMQMGALALIWLMCGRSLAELALLGDACADVMTRYQSQCLAIGSNADYERFYFLGSGYRYGLASEASLKMKEMSLSTSEPFHHMEFRHGPQSMVNEQTLVISVGSQLLNTYEQAVLADMRALGGHTLSIGPTSDCDMHWHSTLDDLLQGIIALPLLQSIAFARATSRGLDPDNPHNLNAVVVLS